MRDSDRYRLAAAQMIYVDTSVWAAMHAREPGSARVQDWFESRQMSALCCSERVKTEQAGALSFEYRRGDLDAAGFADARRAFARLCVAGPTWRDTETQDFLGAAGCCAQPGTGLRAGDSLHLAVPVRTRCEALFSLDKPMNRNAERHGLRVVDL